MVHLHRATSLHVADFVRDRMSFDRRLNSHDFSYERSSVNAENLSDHLPFWIR